MEEGEFSYVTYTGHSDTACGHLFINTRWKLEPRIWLDTTLLTVERTINRDGNKLSLGTSLLRKSSVLVSLFLPSAKVHLSTCGMLCMFRCSTRMVGPRTAMVKPTLSTSIRRVAQVALYKQGPKVQVVRSAWAALFDILLWTRNHLTPCSTSITD